MGVGINWRCPWLFARRCFGVPVRRFCQFAQFFLSRGDAHTMKLLIILVLASVLVLKTAEGAAGDVDDLCDNDTCKDSNAECKDESGTKNCRCKANYENSGGTCKMSNGQTCTADGDCASGFCKDAGGKKCAPTVALGNTCTDKDKCSDANAECKDDGGTDKCQCKANYENSGGTCKLSNGQTCSADSDCAKGTCAKDIKKCGKPNDETCTNDVDCASGNCKTTGTEKKCADGASAIVASVLLMVSALLTSCFL